MELSEEYYQQKKLERQSLLLFDLIADCLPNEGFTLDDVVEGLANNCRKKGISSHYVENIKFGERHVQYLVDNGYLNLDSTTGNYSVNASSSLVAQRLIPDEQRIIEEDDEEQRLLEYAKKQENKPTVFISKDEK